MTAARSDSPQSAAYLNHLLQIAPQLQPPAEWLSRNGAGPERLLRNAIRELERRGRALPAAQRARYAEAVLLGEFFSRWASKHVGRSIGAMAANAGERDSEIRPFELALIAASDHRAFKRITPRMARKTFVERMGMSLGSADEFTGFVAVNSGLLAERFLQNFDSSRPKAAQKALRYVQTTAVSYYLVRRTRPIHRDATNLKDYLAGSRRLSHRTVLAIKLAYLPALLTHADREELTKRYGLAGAVARRLRIKDIAHGLRFRTAASLSRKLYRARAWCRTSASSRKRGGS